MIYRVFIKLYVDMANINANTSHIRGCSAMFILTEHAYDRNTAMPKSSFFFFIAPYFYTENPGVPDGCIRPLDDPHLTIDYQHY